jgi:hypothetical protein
LPARRNLLAWLHLGFENLSKVGEALLERRGFLFCEVNLKSGMVKSE